MQSENACLNTETLGSINRKNYEAVIKQYSIVKNISLHQVVSAYNYSLCDWKVQVKF